MNIKTLIENGENRFVEFKSDYTKTMLKTISAYSNYNTGRIIVGVGDEGSIIGLTDPEQVSLSIENAINDGIDPRPYYEIKRRNISGKSIVELVVYCGENTPYLIRGKAYGRSDTSTVEVDRVEMKRLILKGSNTTFEDLESENQLMTFKYLEKKLREKSGIGELTDDIMVTLGLLKKGSYNNAAALLSDDNEIHNAGIAMIRFEGNSMNKFDSRRFEKESLLHQFYELMNIFRYYYPVTNVIETERRKEIEKIPIVAFREALANAIIHRDYFRISETRVEFFDDRVEIISPGGLPDGISEEEYLDGRVSVPRNRILTDVFFRLGIIERFATGVRRIKEQYIDLEAKPIFSVMENSIKIILPAADRKVRDVVKENFVEYGLTAGDKSIMEYIKKSGFITRLEAEKILKLGKTQTYTVLRRMCDSGVLVKIGRGKDTKYVVR
jgi:ATP-dependent DNA helicase RecG